MKESPFHSLDEANLNETSIIFKTQLGCNLSAIIHMDRTFRKKGARSKQVFSDD